MGMMLFAGLWTLADREGRLEDRPRRIKAQLFPYFRDTDEALLTMVDSAAHHGCRDFAVNVEGMLDALHERGFIIRYDVGTSRYIQIVNFEKHQRPHSNETPSTIPPHNQADIPDRHKTLPTKVDSAANQGEQRFVLIPDTGLSDSLIPDTGLLGGASAPAADAAAPPTPKAKRATDVPADWWPTHELVTWAVEKFSDGLGFDAVIEDETAKFVRHHRSKGNTFKDIGLAWQNWMAKAQEYGRARASPSNGTTVVTTTDRILAAGQRVKERHEQQRSDAGDRADRRGLRAESKSCGTRHGPRDRGLDDRVSRHPVDAVWRERS